MTPRVGMFPPAGLLERGQEATGAFLAEASAAGGDHVCCGDHVSFVAGLGLEFLAPYVAAGAAEFNLIPCAPDPAEAIAAVSAIKNYL
jgi:hypothetical protein